MRTTILVSATLIMLAGCATFKELEPKPDLSPAERGYIELKNDKEDFRLDQGKQYFIRFPKPFRPKFYLVLQTGGKWNMDSYLTRAFDDGKGPITRMQDEAPLADSSLVWAIDTTTQTYFWVIDTVRQDFDLHMRYRYVPRWRYTFENKYAGFKETLASNRVDRETYLCSPGAPAIESLDHAKQLDYVNTRAARLAAMNEELKAVEGLFPPDIAAARDTAYLNYISLRNSVEDELSFQHNYATAISIFQKERDSKGNTSAFLSQAGEFAEFAADRDRYPSPLLEKARKTFLARLSDAVPYYERQLKTKRDVKPFYGNPPIAPVEKLYRACGQGVPPEFAALYGYVQRFNLEAEALRSTTERIKEVNGLIDKTVSPPAQTFYANLAVAAKDIRTAIPAAQAASDDHYRGLEMGGLLALELAKAREQSDDLQGLFGAAAEASLDITNRSWATAEAKARDLYQGRNEKSFSTVSRQRDKVVKWLETDIFNSVRKTTQERLDAFVKLNEATITDIPRVYADSAFMPAYQLTFSSAGPAELAQRKSQIDEYISKVKHYQFPETAIRAIYKDFGRDMNDQGVDRARAIVEHGKMYKGNDKQLTAIVSECDPTVAKWIVRPKEYRRILALPVTNNRRGTNEYMFRIKLQIPSDAQFPVFDINVKLPKELAEGAGREQWYEEITINKNPIKNEGRFRITSPTADNNYESQITPVQVDKEGNNILEVRFKKGSYKVYEISAMAQVPIMKKN